MMTAGQTIRQLLPVLASAATGPSGCVRPSLSSVLRGLHSDSAQQAWELQLEASKQLPTHVYHTTGTLCIGWLLAAVGAWGDPAPLTIYWDINHQQEHTTQTLSAGGGSQHPCACRLCSNSQASSSLAAHPSPLLGPQLPCRSPTASLAAHTHSSVLRAKPLCFGTGAPSWIHQQDRCFSASSQDGPQKGSGAHSSTEVQSGDAPAPPTELPPLPSVDVTYMGPLSSQHKLLKVRYCGHLGC